MFKRYPTPQTVWMSCGFEGSSSSLSRRQSPRTDVTGDILPIFQGKIELIERGALDGLTREDIARFAPREDDYVLVSRLCDGSSVTFGESFIVDRLQNGICELERGGAAAIMVFCTGRFPETLTSRVPMIFPCDLLHKTVPLLTAAKPGETLLVITDDSRVKIGTAIYEAGKELGCEVMLLVMKEREVSGQEPPE